MPWKMCEKVPDSISVGTSFLLFVMIVSIIFFAFIRVDSPVLRLFLRLALIPVIAGVSYELIRLAGRSDNGFVNLISKPGVDAPGAYDQRAGRCDDRSRHCIGGGDL